MLFKIFSFFLIFCLFSPQFSSAESSFRVQNQYWLAQNSENIESAYDPFVDYSEFEDTDEEQKSIDFFQTGRFLTLSFQGGLQLFTQNMALLYEPGPLYGGNLNYFFNLQFAVQFSVLLSTHNIVLTSSTGQPFIGGADFLSIGLDFKYFIDRNLFHRSLNWFQPFFMLGFARSSLTMIATLTNQPGFYEDSGYGLNAGAGFEFLVFKKMYFGLMYTFRFVNFQEEARPLTLQNPDSPQQTQFQPYGDWMHISLMLGVSF